MRSRDLAWFLRRVALGASAVLVVVAVAFFVQGKIGAGVVFALVAALACLIGWDTRGQPGGAPAARPWRYRGIRSERSHRAIKAVFIALWLSVLAVVALLRALHGDAAQGWSIAVIIVFSIGWVAAMAIRLRAFAARMNKDDDIRLPERPEQPRS